MKAIKEHISQPINRSFTIQEYEQAYFDSPWHFHTEYELTYIKKGNGTRFVGTSAQLFKEGDLVLIGTNVPHYWRCDTEFYEQNLKAHSIVIQFDPKLFFENPLPETSAILMLLKKSASGIVFKNSSKYKDILTTILTQKGFEQLLSFYQLIHKLSIDKEQETLSTTIDSQLYQAKDSKIFEKILIYISENIKEHISLDEVATKVHMSTPAFCRYFKKRTKKTFTAYVNNLRIALASKLLIETDLTITQICFECGYNNLSYFNKQFNKFKKIGPKEFRKLHYQK